MNFRGREQRGRGGGNRNLGERQNFGENVRDRQARRGGNRGNRGGFAGNRGGNARGGRPGGAKKSYYLSYHKLEAFSKMQPDDVILQLVRSKEALMTLVKTSELRYDWVKLITKVFGNVLKSTMERNVFDVFAILPGSNFIKFHLLAAIQELPIVFQETTQTDHEDFINDIIAIFERFGESFPSSVSDLPIDNLMSTVSRIQISCKEEVQSKLGKLINHRDQLIAEKMEQLRTDKRNAASKIQGPPPDNFRDLSVLPTMEDVQTNTKPYLRPIKTRGKYSDGEEYLDVQFRLLKEDFISPLREGIEEIRQDLARVNRKQNIKVYRHVKIIAPNCTGGGITHRIFFDVQKLQHVAWQHSRRLIYGSIVCFSDDNFKTCFFATVVNRKPEDLVKGEVDVQFLNGLDDIIDLTIDDQFLMVESPSYFEAYKHVLHVLQAMNGDKIPFADYIVSATSVPNHPKYIRTNIASCSYNLSGCLTDIGDPCRTSLYGIESWKERSVLNQSQLIAVKKALSREFTIIQGPPGTGKTYVGLRIVHALLKNKEIWQGNRKPNILLVCYTNHALDQFVEGLVKLGHMNIARVGSRCQNEIVQQFALNRIKQDSDLHQETKPITTAIGNITSEKYEIIDELRELSSRLEELERSQLSGKIVGLHAVKRFLPESLQNWFIEMDRRTRYCDIPFLEMFLGLYPFFPGLAEEAHWRSREIKTVPFVRHSADMETRRLDRGEGNADAEGNDFVDIEGEAEALTERFAVGQEEFVPLYDKFSNQIENPEDDDIEEEFIDQDGFKMVMPSRRQRRARAQYHLNRTDPLTEEQVEAIRDPMRLSEADRWRLYKYLLDRYRRISKERLVPIARKYDECCRNIKELEQRKDEFYLRQREIIAMTTTCTARYRQALGRVQPKIIIVEEAAEVLEAHVIASLVEGAEHLILIGDHKQLKPKPSVYQLAMKYNLELSLFERMIRNGMDCHTLDIQHRMRPDIARLLQDIYPDLGNHPSVSQYPDVKGVASNLYFIDHQFQESENDELRSKSNEHEAHYIVALCWYLLLQGYSPEKITILTLYTGQLLLLKKLMRKDKFHGIRVTAVDNFQGEENDIILLSLVRSNNDGKIGFAGTENRVCVSLSRARHGLFVIGNTKMLEKESAVWKRILARASSADQVGTSLRLFCRNHPEMFIDAANAEDFNGAPEGGCREPCTYRLNCGHVCQKACHPVDQEHLQVKCGKRCNKILCTFGHRCSKLCHFGDECGPCNVRVPKIIPICNHEQQVPCHMEPEEFDCKHPVTITLICGHSKDASCCEKDTKDAKCFEKCKEMLECGHQCQGTCNDCCQGRLHIRCQKDCKRVLVCSHLCQEPCSKECPPCKENCNNGCSHSSCPKKCGDVCAPCLEKCQWRCEHKSCPKLCSEMCDRTPCEESCDLLLKCNHPCIGLCGEKCPPLCRFCNKDIVEEIFFGTEDEEDARFVQLLDCGHVFEVTGLDEWVALETDGSSTIAVKTCPKCKTPIRRSMRYANVIKKAMEDINSVKKTMIGERRKGTTGNLTRLKNALSLLTNNLLATGNVIRRLAFPFHSMRQSTTHTGEYKELISLLKDKCKSIEEHILLETSNIETISENQIECVERIAKLFEGKILMKINDGIFKQFVMEVAKLCTDNNVTVQQMQDVDLELKRLYLYKAVFDTVKYVPEADLKKSFELLHSGRKISSEKIEEMHKENDSVRKKHGLGMITKEERQMVIKAMGFSAGHWYKCPNGHVYAIGDCGGANQESKCPECKATIGGTHHRLAAGNAHAGEFDDSRHAAWSDGANLAHFDPNDLGLF